MLAAAIIGGLYIEYGTILSVDLTGTPLGDKATEVAVKVVTDTAEELKRLAATADKELPGVMRCLCVCVGIMCVCVWVWVCSMYICRYHVCLCGHVCACRHTYSQEKNTLSFLP